MNLSFDQKFAITFSALLLLKKAKSEKEKSSEEIIETRTTFTKNSRKLMLH